MLNLNLCLFFPPEFLAAFWSVSVCMNDYVVGRKRSYTVQYDLQMFWREFSAHYRCLPYLNSPTLSRFVEENH